MKKTISILICLLLLGSTIAFADEFNERSAYHHYSGGYVISDMAHYTLYSLNQPRTVGAGIKVGANATEVNDGFSKSSVYSKYDVGPYYKHTHYKYKY